MLPLSSVEILNFYFPPNLLEECEAFSSLWNESILVISNWPVGRGELVGREQGGVELEKPCR